MSDLRTRIAAIISRELPGVSFALPMALDRLPLSSAPLDALRLADILVRELSLRQEEIEDWHGKTTRGGQP